MLAAAGSATDRATNVMAAVEWVQAVLAAQDFGRTHLDAVGALHELMTRQAGLAAEARRIAQQTLANAQRIIEVCAQAAAAFRRDHGRLAEARANAPRAARTREAYRPL